MERYHLRCGEYRAECDKSIGRAVGQGVFFKMSGLSSSYVKLKFGALYVKMRP